MDRAIYLKEVYDTYYMSEVFGEAAFARAYRLEDDPVRRAKWAALLQLETETKARLRPFLMSVDVRLDEPDTTAEIARVFENWQQLGWNDKMSAVLEEANKFQERFVAIAAAAPPHEQAISQAMLRHEEAIITFAERELDGDPSSSLDRVLDLLVFPVPVTTTA